jgi:nucleotide-binding universal stress UspA family protein
MKILLAVDGSHASEHAVSALLNNLTWFRENPHVDLVYVQHLVRAGTASALVSLDTTYLQRYYEHDGEEVVQEVAKRLGAANLSFKFHLLMGEAADQICSFAEEHGSDLIYMGTRGMGALGNLLLGSTATKVLHKARVPVTLVSDRHPVGAERAAEHGQSTDLPSGGSYLPFV